VELVDPREIVDRNSLGVTTCALERFHDDRQRIPTVVGVVVKDDLVVARRH
jgi:hypothetical protein